MKHFRLIPLLVLFVLFSLQGKAGNNLSAVRDFQSREGTSWTFHLLDDGKVRALYGRDGGRKIFNEKDARLFFADYAEMFGIQDESHLRFENLEKESSGSSYVFRQYVLGLPVVGGELAVHTNSGGQVLAAGGRYHTMKGLIGVPVDRRREARATASRLRFANGNVSSGILMILPGLKQARIVWKFDTMSKIIPGLWAVYVDALLPAKVLRIQRQYFEAQATGAVFEENPVVTPALSNERFLHLKDSSALTGKFTKIFNANSQLPFPRNGDLTGYNGNGIG